MHQTVYQQAAFFTMIKEAEAGQLEQPEQAAGGEAEQVGGLLQQGQPPDQRQAALVERQQAAAGQ
jgi:hypothetical protein